MFRGPRNKYGNKRTEVAGRKFASKAEGKRYAELLWLQSVGKITGLELQKRYPLNVNDRLVTTYVADFVYRDETGETVVEDVKGFRTELYKLKAKLMKAVKNIDVVEV